MSPGLLPMSSTKRSMRRGLIRFSSRRSNNIRQFTEKNPDLCLLSNQRIQPCWCRLPCSTTIPASPRNAHHHLSSCLGAGGIWVCHCQFNTSFLYLSKIATNTGQKLSGQVDNSRVEQREHFWGGPVTTWSDHQFAFCCCGKHDRLRRKGWILQQEPGGRN